MKATIWVSNGYKDGIIGCYRDVKTVDYDEASRIARITADGYIDVIVHTDVDKVVID